MSATIVTSVTWMISMMKDNSSKLFFITFAIACAFIVALGFDKLNEFGRYIAFLVLGAAWGQVAMYLILTNNTRYSVKEPKTINRRWH